MTNYERADEVRAALEANPDDYVSDLGVARSGTHGSVTALAMQLVVCGEATDLADGIGKVLAVNPGLYAAMLRDTQGYPEGMRGEDSSG
jgi:hypothetical protein